MATSSSDVHIIKMLEICSETGELKDITLPIDMLFSIKTVTQGRHTVEWVDRQISLLQSYRLHIQSLSNQLLPINQLPIEVLSCIFRCCMALSQTASHSIQARSLNFSHVCRHWRSIALDNPEVWATISFEFPQIAKELISRSQHHPLDLSMNISRQYIVLSKREGQLKELIDIINTKWAQIRSLSVTTGSRSVTKLVPYLSNAPSLEYLLVRSYFINIDDTNPFHNAQPITAPRLQHLHLINSTLPLSIPQPLHHLTTLEIVNKELRSDLCLSISTLLQLLEEAPNIKYVKLHHTLSASLSDSTTADTRLPICLHALERLELSRHENILVGVVLDLLSSLRMPALAQPGIQSQITFSD